MEKKQGWKTNKTSRTSYAAETKPLMKKGGSVEDDSLYLELSNIDHTRVIKWMNNHFDSESYDIKKSGNGYVIDTNKLSKKEVEDLKYYLKSQMKEGGSVGSKKMAKKDLDKYKYYLSREEELSNAYNEAESEYGEDSDDAKDAWSDLGSHLKSMRTFEQDMIKQYGKDFYKQYDSYVDGKMKTGGSVEDNSLYLELSNIDHTRVIKWMNNHFDSESYDIKKSGNGYVIDTNKLSKKEVEDLKYYLKSQMKDGGSVGDYKIDDAVSYKRKLTGVKNTGKVIEIDKDGKYLKVRNNMGNIDYLPTNEVKKMKDGGDVSFSPVAVEEANIEELFQMADEIGLTNYQLLNKEILRKRILEYFKLTRFRGRMKEGGSVGRSKWKLTIDLNPAWKMIEDEDDLDSFIEGNPKKWRQFTDKVTEILNDNFEKVEAIVDETDLNTYQDIIDYIHSADDTEDFDYEMNRLYDIADENKIFVQAMYAKGGKMKTGGGVENEYTRFKNWFDNYKQKYGAKLINQRATFFGAGTRTFGEALFSITGTEPFEDVYPSNAEAQDFVNKYNSGDKMKRGGGVGTTESNIHMSWSSTKKITEDIERFIFDSYEEAGQQLAVDVIEAIEKGIEFAKIDIGI